LGVESSAKRREFPGFANLSWAITAFVSVLYQPSASSKRLCDLF
jgi:hypothetical protein